MYISNTLYHTKVLNNAEKIAMAYIMKGLKRIKYIPDEKLADIIGCTRQWAGSIKKSLENKGYIKLMKPEGSRYYLIVVLNKSFYSFIDSKNVVPNENHEITKDKAILLYAKQQYDSYDDRDENFWKIHNFLKRLSSKNT